MIQGFYTLPDKEEKEYGIKIVPALNFEIIEDDRFSVKYNGWKFNNVDEKGIPKDLDKFNGGYTLYTGRDGLSRVLLDRKGDLNVWIGNLANFFDGGRVVFVESRSGASQNFEVEKEINNKISKLGNLKREYLNKVRNI